MRNKQKFNETQRRQIRHWKKKIRIVGLYKKLEVLDYAAKGYTNIEISNVTIQSLKKTWKKYDI